MLTDVCPLPREWDLIRRCFEERSLFIKGDSWFGFRQIFGPFLSGRQDIDIGWKEDRRIFDKFILRRLADIRNKHSWISQEARKLAACPYDDLWCGVRALLVINTLRTLGCTLGYNTAHRIAGLSMRLARCSDATVLDHIIADCHAETEKLLVKCPSLQELAAQISREDPRWVKHTAWQILFASVESTALSIQSAFGVWYGTLSEDSEPRSQGKRDIRQMLQTGLFYYPSTYNMVFNLENLREASKLGVNTPAAVHIAVDRANRAIQGKAVPHPYSRYGLAFGGGPRLCPGRNLALREALLVSNSLLAAGMRPSVKFDYARRGFFAHFEETPENGESAVESV